jgi:succinate-semialdehyde dehydrogenase/glutarate-semialdehyde dehydrogenase
VAKFTDRLLARSPAAPLSSQAAADHLARQVDAAVAQGATLASAGQRQGAYFPAGVLTGVTTEH